MAKNDEAFLTIPFPRQTQNVNRLGKVSAVEPMFPVSIRMTQTDRFEIDKVANSIGMGFSEFVRWAAFYTAIAVSNEMQRRSFDTSQVTLKPKIDTSEYS